MKRNAIITLIISASLTVSCSKNENYSSLNGSDYLVFGHFYGECYGEGCVEIYKLTATELFEDMNDNYPGVVEDFNFTKLSDEQYEEVRDLIDFFPGRLLSEDEHVLGCPDCADQGGIYVLYSKNGRSKSWLIDRSESPEYLHAFTKKIDEKILLIND